MYKNPQFPTITLINILIYSIIFFLHLNCKTIPQEEKPPALGIWQLKDYNVSPEWTDNDRKIPFLLASLPTIIPKKYVLEQIPLPGNQGNQASGTAFALGYFGTTYIHLKNPKTKRGYQCAPAFIYNTISKGEDKGIGMLEALKLLKEQGCPEEEYMPYNQYDSATQPGGRARENATLYKIKDFGRVEYTDLDQVKAHLLQEKPVFVILTISDNFIDLKNDIWEYPEGNVRGKHTVALYGYDDLRRSFLFVNSAGQKWGKNGYSSIPYPWFVRLAKQAYIMW